MKKLLIICIFVIGIVFISGCTSEEKTKSETKIIPTYTETEEEIGYTNTSGEIDGSSYIGNANGIPKFVTTDYIERNKIKKISKFRSSEGHDFSDDFESCRSMKHYFVPFDTYYSNLEIFAPVDGSISYMREEWAGTQIGIKSKDYPDYTFIIFHVNSENLNVGDEVYAGQKIGTHIGRQTTPNIAVKVNTSTGMKWVSYFDVMTDCLFQEYQEQGITSLDEVIIQKDARDANPLICDRGKIITIGILENWVFFDTTSPKLISSNPPDGEINVPFTQRTISFTFNEPMRADKGVLWPGLNSVRSEVKWSSDQKTIYFTFYENFPINTTVSWFLNPSVVNLDCGHMDGFKDLSENLLPFDTYSGSFNTSNDVDTISVENAKESIDESSCIGYANGIPKFITTDYIERNKIKKISKFRSSEGHDFSDDFESCRSMKHYFVPFDTYYSNLEIFAPVDGSISYMREEWAGTQIGIKSKDYPDYTFIIFHVNSENLNVGDEVYAGQKIGTHIGSQTNSDIAVQFSTPTGMKWVSYFDVMTDCLFQEYQEHGLTSRDEVIIQKDARDADPLTCEGETFTDTGNLENWIFLN